MTALIVATNQGNTAIVDILKQARAQEQSKGRLTLPFKISKKGSVQITVQTIFIDF